MESDVLRLDEAELEDGSPAEPERVGVSSTDLAVDEIDGRGDGYASPGEYRGGEVGCGSELDDMVVGVEL